MVKKLFSIFLLLIFSLVALCQIDWQRSIGSTQDERGYDAVEDADGNIYVIAASNGSDGDIANNLGGYDLWMNKLDPNGNVIWEKSLGDSLNNFGYSIAELTPNKYVVCGLTQNTNAMGLLNNDGWLIAVDSAGNDLWQKRYGGSNDDGFREIVKVSDNKFAIAGFARSNDVDIDTMRGVADGWLVWIDTSGNLTESKTYGGSSFDEFVSITYKNNQLLASGRTRSIDGMITGLNGSYDSWVMLADSLGNNPANHVYGGSLNEIANDAIFTSDGNMLIVSDCLSADGDVTDHLDRNDIWAVKADLSGNILWSKSYGGSNEDFVSVAIETSSQEYIFGCVSLSTDGMVTNAFANINVWLIKTNPSGNLIWEYTTGGNLDENIFSFLEVTNGFLLVGDSDSDDEDLAGVSKHLVHDVWVVKYSDIRVLSVDDIDEVTFKAYPNPTTEQLIIENYQGWVKTYNASGKLMFKKYITSLVDLQHLTTGKYFIELDNKEVIPIIKLQ